MNTEKTDKENVGDVIQLEKSGLTSHRPPELIDPNLVFKESVAAKLWEIGAYEYSQPLKDCHTIETICHCLHCNARHRYWNRCDRFYCPSCSKLLTWKRQKTILPWIKEVKQPKHVVLTARNRNTITKTYVKFLKKSLSKLRRTHFARNWRGGLWRMETTNESKGWHVHFHLLIDCPWIDAGNLAREWANQVRQDCAIVKVIDAREKDYLHEVTKYVVKGAEIAKWDATDIAFFIDSFQGSRTFGVFGSLFKSRARMKQLLKELNDYTPECKSCGSQELEYISPEMLDWKEHDGSRIPTVHAGANSNDPTSSRLEPARPQLDLFRERVVCPVQP